MTENTTRRLMLRSRNTSRPSSITKIASRDTSGATTDRVVISGHSRGCYNVWANAGATFDPDALAEECAGMSDGGCTEEELDAFSSGALADPRIVGAVPMGCGYRDGFFGEAAMRRRDPKCWHRLVTRQVRRRVSGKEVLEYGEKKILETRSTGTSRQNVMDSKD